jgi:hypothetical protein
LTKVENRSELKNYDCLNPEMATGIEAESPELKKLIFSYYKRATNGSSFFCFRKIVFLTRTYSEKPVRLPK